MRFVADAMLGKLARWLRLMGYDVLYNTDCTDDDMLENVKDRIILTRDREFFKRAENKNFPALLISDDGIKGQLMQLKEEVGLVLLETPELARCPVCNGRLEVVEKEKITEKVPESISDFFKCRACENVYWEGGHWKNIKETIKEVEDRGKNVQNPKG